MTTRSFRPDDPETLWWLPPSPRDSLPEAHQASREQRVETIRTAEALLEQEAQAEAALTQAAHTAGKTDLPRRHHGEGLRTLDGARKTTGINRDRTWAREDRQQAAEPDPHPQ